MPATEEELKKAFKAFKKRVKLTQLNDDSRLGHSPLTGKRETVVAIQPPTGFGREIWEELADKIGVPRGQLRETAERFNHLARKGHDDDFNRGESAYDNYYGDPTLPNPNLHPLGKPPYYAFQIIL